MERNNGILESWNNGQHSIIPFFQYSLAQLFQWLIISALFPYSTDQ